MTFLLYEDIGPAPEIAQRAWDVPAGEDVEIRINSCGGDVFGGLAIVAAVNTFRTNGHKTRAVVEGLAASMASVVACACDELVMHEGSMLMIHNPWTLIEGDAEELKKQAEIMGKIKNTMIGIYQKKFAMSSEEISRLMDEETWISTDDIEKYKLDAEVIEGTARIAASVTKERYYAKLKERRMTNEKDKDEDEQKPVEEKPTEETPVEEKPTEDTEDTDDDKPAEDEDEDDTVEELRERIAELEQENEELKRQLDAPVEERVRGMQSKMQARINAREKEFENQLQARKEELTQAHAEVTSLRADLEKVTNELQTTASALATKTNALETLNSGVLTPHAVVPTPHTRDEARRALAKTPMGERAAYYKTHRDLIDG